MNRDTHRYTFQVAWSEEDREYVGTAVEFPTLSHRTATAEAALAGIQQLVADALDGLDTDEKPPPCGNEKQCPVPCLICGRNMESSPVSETQPSEGVTIHIFGNYGSGVFDPMDDANWLQAALCDGCLRSAITAERVLYVWRSRAATPPPMYRIATSESTIAIRENPHLM
jgi:hypothetical protein